MHCRLDFKRYVVKCISEWLDHSVSWCSFTLIFSAVHLKSDQPRCLLRPGINRLLVCGETGTFATSFCGFCCYGYTCAFWQGSIVLQVAWKTKVCQYCAVLRPTAWDSAVFVQRKSHISVSLSDFVSHWILNHSSKRNVIQVFVHETLKKKFLIVDKNVQMSNVFLLWGSTLWWQLCQAPKYTIMTLTQTSHTSAIKLSVQAPLQTMQTHLNTPMFLLNVLFISSCAFYNRHRTVDVSVPHNTNTVWICLSECVELEEDFCIFCILCIGDVLYFLTALKKYVYHCFIFVTNTTQDKCGFFFQLFLCTNSSSVPWIVPSWTPNH